MKVAKHTERKKIIEVHIDKGMKDGQQIRFHGEGDQSPGMETGDVCIVLDEQAHPVFQRQKGDLVMKMNISLSEALCGFTRTIKTLDDRTLVINTKPGEVIQNGAVRAIQHEGMPQYKNPYEKGQLIVKFAVDFPESNFLSESDLGKLKNLLATSPETAPLETAMIPDDAEECVLHDYVPTKEGARQQQRAGGFSHMFGGMQADDDDDEEGHPGMGGGQRVQCANQ